MLSDTEAFCSKPGYRARTVFDWKQFITIPYCEPDCNLDNGGCEDDEVCSLRKRSCYKGALVCPDTIECTKQSNGDGSNAMSGIFVSLVITKMTCILCAYVILNVNFIPRRELG